MLSPVITETGENCSWVYCLGMLPATQAIAVCVLPSAGWEIITSWGSCTAFW